jgi:hypothetical protein
MNSTFQTYPKQQPHIDDFEVALHAMRARQDQILQAIGERTVEITPGLMDELAGLDLILGVYPLEEVFHD